MAETKNLNLSQTRFLQPLRSNTVHTTVQAAIEDIQAIQSSLATTTHSDGISVIARYKLPDTTETKSVLGIYSYVGNSFTYFVHDYDTIEKVIKRVSNLETLVGEKSISEQIAEAITTELAKLDVAAIGGNGKLVTTVSQTDGRISAEVIDATAANIAVADTTNVFTATNVEGVLVEIDTAYKAADANLQKAIDELETAINDLDSTAISTNGQYVNITVVQTDGELTSATVDETALNTKIDALQKEIDNVEISVKAAMTKVQLGEDEAHLELSETVSTDNAITYILSTKDVASASALTEEISNRETAINNLLGSVEETDAKTIAALNDKIEAVSDAAKSYKIEPASIDELGTNVKEAWKLTDEKGTQAGSTIVIYKDSSLEKVELVGQELQFTYLLANGNTSMVPVDVSNFLAESEFKNGLQVVDHIVSVKLAEGSEDFLSVGEDGIKLSGVQDAINDAVAAEASARTDADNAILGDVKTYNTLGKLEDAIEALETAIGEGGSVTTQITNAINDLDYTDAAVDGSYVSQVTQTDGVIAVQRVELPSTSITSPQEALAYQSATIAYEIVQEKGKITSLNIVGNNIASQEELTDLSNRLDNLSNKTITAISVNEVGATITNKVATVTVEGDNIAVSSEYGDAVTYPTLSNTAVTFTAVEGSDKVDDAIKKLDQNVATLVQEVLNNEEVTAAALTKHNESCGFDENANYIVNENATYISAATSLAEADNLLDAAINNEVDSLRQYIEQVSNNAISVVNGNGINITSSGTQKTIAAVAKVDDSLIEVTTDGIGIKEDGYIDCGTF